MRTKIYLILFLCLAVTTQSYANPNKDIKPLEVSFIHFPGNEVSSHQNNFQLNSSMVNVMSNFGYPISDKWVVLGGLQMNTVWSTFGKVELNTLSKEVFSHISNQFVRQSSYSISAGVMRILDNKDQIIVRFAPSFDQNSAGNYNYNFMLNMLYRSPNSGDDDMNWAVGMAIVNNFERTIPVPVAILNYPYENWFFEMVLPQKIDINYNLSDQISVGSRLFLYSEIHNLSAGDVLNFGSSRMRLTHINLLGGAMIKWRINDFLRFDAGVYVPLYTDFMSQKVDNLDISVNQKVNVFAGLNLLIPKALFKKK